MFDRRLKLLLNVWTLHICAKCYLFAFVFCSLPVHLQDYFVIQLSSIIRDICRNGTLYVLQFYILRDEDADCSWLYLFV